MNNIFIPENLPDDFFEDKSSPEGSASEVEKRLIKVDQEIDELKKKIKEDANIKANA